MPKSPKKPQLRPPLKLKPPPTEGKQPRALEAPPQPAQAEIVHAPVRNNKNMRMMAKLDFVTDPEARSVKFHYDRPDREYLQVSYDTFRKWASDDLWVQSREEYFKEIETRIIAGRLDRLLEQRFKELDNLEEDLRYMHEYVTPLRDQYGNVVRHPLYHEVGDPRKGTLRQEMHPFAGLPKYALPFSSMESLITAFLKMDERLMLKRGDATTRSESTSSVELSANRSVLSPDVLLTTVTKEDRAAMAKALLFAHQPELMQQEPLEVAILVEKTKNDDSGNTI